METCDDISLLRYFEGLEDPRKEINLRHKLIDIIVIAITAVISGADDWASIEEYGEAKIDWLKSFLELPNGIPSHDTFGRVFKALDIQRFSELFVKWTREVFKVTEGEVVAIDGKTVRRSHDKTGGKAAIHMVNAWASTSGFSMGQVKTSEKSNEITAIPELLEILDIKGCIVTMDAMGCQKAIASKIVEKGADYALAVKDNHKALRADIQAIFEELPENELAELGYQKLETVDGDHGRVETREYYLLPDVSWLPDKEKWEGVKSVGMVKSKREIDGKTGEESRYYITSLPVVETFARAVRSHWGVENSLHWCLDVSFSEDDHRARKGNSAASFAILRQIALNLLKKENTAKVGIKNKRKKAGWDHAYLLKVLDG